MIKSNFPNNFFVSESCFGKYFFVSESCFGKYFYCFGKLFWKVLFCFGKLFWKVLCSFGKYFPKVISASVKTLSQITCRNNFPKKLFMCDMAFTPILLVAQQIQTRRTGPTRSVDACEHRNS